MWCLVWGASYINIVDVQISALIFRFSPLLLILADFNTGVSQIRVPQCILIFLVMGTLSMVPLILGNCHLAPRRKCCVARARKDIDDGYGDWYRV